VSFVLAEGVSVASLDGIFESYQVRKGDDCYFFIANISTDRLFAFISKFLQNLEYPAFFILEVPTNEKVELELAENGNITVFHKDVYYIDGCDSATLHGIFEKYSWLLLNDGMAKFGFASHFIKDEIFIGKYKIVNIFSTKKTKTQNLFDAFGIPELEKIKTVWNTFTPETPGECCRIADENGKDTYDLIEALKPLGLYFAERREE
jgi:hypothetical protein